jgi:segregation and condensation protein B
MEAKKTLEAALFISTKPIMINELGKISGVNSLGHVKELLEEIQKEYSNRGVEVVQTQDGWQMQVRPEVLPNVSHLTPYSDLSGGVKRTLAIVAYKEPVLQSEVIKHQGNKAYSYVKELVKRGLVKAEKKGHTKELNLTQEFERYFGEDRKTIKERMRKMMETGEEKPEPEPETPEEPQYIDEKKPKKEKVKVSVQEEDEDDEPEEEPEVEGQGDSQEETQEEPKEENGGKVRASHDHAFKELD